MLQEANCALLSVQAAGSRQPRCCASTATHTSCAAAHPEQGLAIPRLRQQLPSARQGLQTQRLPGSWASLCLSHAVLHRYIIPEPALPPVRIKLAACRSLAVILYCCELPKSHLSTFWKAQMKARLASGFSCSWPCWCCLPATAQGGQHPVNSGASTAAAAQGARRKLGRDLTRAWSDRRRGHGLELEEGKLGL